MLLLILRAEISYLGRDGCFGAAGVSIDMLSSDAATRIAYPVSDIISVLCAVLCSGDNACVKYTSAQCQVFERLIIIISSTSTNHRFRDNHAPELRRTTLYKSMAATENYWTFFKTIE